jgi:hypothetical protein
VRKDPSGACPDELPRYVVDESSFDFTGHSDEFVEACLDRFNTCLKAFLAEDSVAVADFWTEVDCIDGMKLYEFLYAKHREAIDPDTLRLTGVLLDHCSELPEDDPDALEPINIDGIEYEFASGVSYAYKLADQGTGVACIMVPVAPRLGPTTTRRNGTERKLFFIADHSARSDFWRYLFEVEKVTESAFFSYAKAAFRALEFAEGLDFSKFDGRFQDNSSRVVEILGALNDNFARSLTSHAGQTHRVIAELQSLGVVASPESPNTHKNVKAMAQRKVTHLEMEFVCEWHAKIRPNINRIHFSLPDSRIEGKVLIGIFIDHLGT